MWINKESNQHELMKAARELLAERNIAVKKLSYLPEKACVQVTCDGSFTPIAGKNDAWEEISDAYDKLTGAQLILKE